MRIFTWATLERFLGKLESIYSSSAYAASDASIKPWESYGLRAELKGLGEKNLLTANRNLYQNYDDGSFTSFYYGSNAYSNMLIFSIE